MKSLSVLKKYYPDFFKTEFANPSKEVKHYVTRDV